MFRRFTIKLWGPVCDIGRSAWVPALSREDMSEQTRWILVLTSSNETRLVSRSETVRRLRKQQEADAAKHPGAIHQELTKIIEAKLQ
jgi:23S rRNA A1618 N6-methylase RlmF